MGKKVGVLFLVSVLVFFTLIVPISYADTTVQKSYQIQLDFDDISSTSGSWYLEINGNRVSDSYGTEEDAKASAQSFCTNENGQLSTWQTLYDAQLSKRIQAICSVTTTTQTPSTPAPSTAPATTPTTTSQSVVGPQTTTTIVPADQCAPENIIAYVTGTSNSHVSLTQTSDFSFALCFKSQADQFSDVLDFSNKHTDYTFNRLLRLSSQTNGHVEAANYSNYASTLAYNSLDCRLDTASTLAANEQIIARVSNWTNAHIASAQTQSASYPLFLICQEQICNQNRYNAVPVFPAFANFEPQEKLQITASAQAAFTLQANQKAKGAQALQLRYTMQNNAPAYVQIANKLTDLSAFTDLEFQYYYTDVSGLSLDFVASDGTTQRVSIDKSVVGTLKRNVWNTIRIPLASIDKSKSIVAIRFVVDTTYATYSEIPKAYVYYVDFMSFYGENELARQFCGAQILEGVPPTYMWTSNLDAVVSQFSCSNIPGFSWTGTQCCGDDRNEIYADGAKGCFGGTLIENNTFFDTISYTVNGVSYSTLCYSNNGASCVFPFPTVQINPQGTYKLENTSTKASILYDDQTNLTTVPKQIVANMYRATYAYGAENTTPLQNAYYYCSNEAGVNDQLIQISYDDPQIGQSCRIVNNAYCSPRGFFSKENIDPTNPNGEMKLSKDISTNDYDCCPVNSCYHDNKCYADQFSGQTPTQGFEQIENNVCYQGIWKPAIKKINFDGTQEGFCPQANMCFVSSGFPGKCVADTEHYQNYYCQNGDWTSRTALLAQVLAETTYDETAQTKGALYCDSLLAVTNRVSVLNSVQLGGVLTQCSSSYDVDCSIYSACVVTTDSSTTVGLVLNKAISEIEGFESAFTAGCDESATTLTKCANENYYYDNTTLLFVYSQTEKSFGNYVVTFWKQKIVDNLRSFFTGTNLKTHDLRNVDASSLFQKLYYNVANNATISAYFEQRGNLTNPTLQSYYVFTYNDQNIDLCEDVISPYNIQRASANPLFCSKQGDGSYDVVGKESAGSLWPYLTGRLRP